MRSPRTWFLPAFCAVCAAGFGYAPFVSAQGHSTASRSPVALLGADDSDEDENATRRPEGPPRIAQYPLENDPYERTPDVRRPPAYSAPTPAPNSIPPLAEEETPWLNWDETRFQGNYVHDSPDGLGIIDTIVSAKIKTGLPGVSINPQFGAHFLGSTGLPDVPGHLYDVSVEFTAGMPLGDDWILMGAVSPSVFSDFSAHPGDSFRLPVRLLAFYKWSEALTIAGGILYLDRKDVGLLPAVGLSYKPSDTFNMDLWFPRPKISWRYLKQQDLERWVYLVGEFGGGSWGVERDDGAADIFSYRDYRAMVGIEQREEGGLNWFTEAGLIFNRSYELDRANISVDLDNTAAMQFGLRF